MTFLQLNYIVEVYNCGSINKAAQNLFISQSCLSSTIRELETEIGIQIFIRSNRGITLTEEGREFLIRIRPIVEQQKKLEHYYKDERLSIKKAHLRISAQRYPFCAQAFVDFLSCQDAEKYEFSFKETEMAKVIEDVSRRDSDIGIIFLSNLTEKFMNKVLGANDLEFLEIKRVHPHIFLRTSHPLAACDKITVKALAEYPYVVFAKKNHTSFNFSEEIIFWDPSEFQKIIYINDRATAYNIITHSDAFSTGSGLLPKGYVPPNLKSVPICGKTDTMRLGCIKLKDAPLKPKAKEFLTFLKQVVNADN